MLFQDQRLIKLLHLSDSAWPTGGFAYSNGLEALAKFGHLRDMSAFNEYLQSHLLLLSQAELPFINSAFALNLDHEEEMLVNMIDDWHAWNTVETMRCSSRLLGENWFDLIEGVYAPKGIEQIRVLFNAESRPKYYPVILPLLLRLLDFDLPMIQRLFFHLAVRDQCNAAVRLGLFGPRKSQELYVKGADCAERVRIRYQSSTFTQARRSQPMLEMAQGTHQHLYSKLFQN